MVEDRTEPGHKRRVFGQRVCFCYGRTLLDGHNAESVANAARIVASVNACEGLNPGAVPGAIAALIDARKALSDILDNHPDVWPGDRGRAEQTPERKAWRDRITRQSRAAREAIVKVALS